MLITAFADTLNPVHPVVLHERRSGIMTPVPEIHVDRIKTGGIDTAELFANVEFESGIV